MTNWCDNAMLFIGLTYWSSSESLEQKKSGSEASTKVATEEANASTELRVQALNPLYLCHKAKAKVTFSTLFYIRNTVIKFIRYYGEYMNNVYSMKTRRLKQEKWTSVLKVPKQRVSILLFQYAEIL